MRGFKVSRDPDFVDQLEDIVGLYLSPLEHALVLCCDEKSQVQALDRTQPGLPIDRETPKGKTLHLIAHKPQAVHLDQERCRHLAEGHSRQQPHQVLNGMQHCTRSSKLAAMRLRTATCTYSDNVMPPGSAIVCRRAAMLTPSP